MRPVAAAAILTLTFTAPVLAQTPALRGTGAAAAQRVLAKVRVLQELQRGRPPASFAEELQRRVEIDQAIRDWSWQDGLPIEERRASFTVIGPAMDQIDAENTTWLKSRLPPDGWFTFSRDGEDVTNNAFLIVQHSPDATWRKETVRKMEPLVMDGEAAPGSFALMYDRVMLSETGKQRYGTQGVCRAGNVVIADMDAPDKVQERRNTIKFTQPLFADYQRSLETQKC